MKMRHRVPLIVLVCATLLSAQPALAQFSQQGPKLVGTGAVGNASQGYSVSLSADGNTAIIAANLEFSADNPANAGVRDEFRLNVFAPASGNSQTPPTPPPATSHP